MKKSILKHVLFLDIDGVLNSSNYFNSDAYKRKEQAGEPYPDKHLDEFLMLRMNVFCSMFNLEIVISSSWREYEYCIPALRRNGLKAPIIGKTPMLPGKTRGQEIREWLIMNDPCHYIIIDDDPDMLPEQQKFFVKTDNRTGFDAKAFKKAVKIVTKNLNL